MRVVAVLEVRLEFWRSERLTSTTGACGSGLARLWFHEEEKDEVREREEKVVEVEIELSEKVDWADASERTEAVAEEASDDAYDTFRRAE